MKKSRLPLVAFWLLLVSVTLVGVCRREFYFTGTSLHLARWPLLAFLLPIVYAFYLQNRRTFFAISAATLLLLANETLWTHALKAQPTVAGTASGHTRNGNFFQIPVGRRSHLEQFPWACHRSVCDSFV